VAAQLCSPYSPVTGQRLEDFGVWFKCIFAPLWHASLPENKLICPHLVHWHWMQTGQAASLPLPGHAQPLTPLNWASGRNPLPKPAGFPMLITSDRHRCLPVFAITTVSRQLCILEASPSTLNQSKQFHRQNVMSASTQSLLIEPVMDVTHQKHSAYTFSLLAKALSEGLGKQLREAQGRGPLLCWHTKHILKASCDY